MGSGGATGIFAAVPGDEFAAAELERIDLYQLHRIDPKVPAEDQFGELKKMQDEGKIRHIGLSEVKPEEIEKARKTIKVVSVQNLYNISDRQHEDTLEYCEKNKIGFHSMVPGGVGKLAKPGGVLDTARRSTTRRWRSWRWRGCCIARR